MTWNDVYWFLAGIVTGWLIDDGALTTFHLMLILVLVVVALRLLLTPVMAWLARKWIAWP